jgi:hypothetical protein
MSLRSGDSSSDREIGQLYTLGTTDRGRADLLN